MKRVMTLIIAGTFALSAGLAQQSDMEARYRAKYGRSSTAEETRQREAKAATDKAQAGAHESHEAEPKAQHDRCKSCC